MKENDPEAYEARRKEGYIKGVPDEGPAVISVNMATAAEAINNFLDRIHPYRGSHSARYAQVFLNIHECSSSHDPPPEPDRVYRRWFGQGDRGLSSLIDFWKQAS